MMVACLAALAVWFGFAGMSASLSSSSLSDDEVGRSPGARSAAFWRAIAAWRFARAAARRSSRESSAAVLVEDVVIGRREGPALSSEEESESESESEESEAVLVRGSWWHDVLVFYLTWGEGAWGGYVRPTWIPARRLHLRGVGRG